jgi:hypothetical protein
MTYSGARFSAAAAFAIFIFMGFTTGALGQGTVSGNVEPGSMALSRTSLSPAPVGVLLAMLEPLPDYRRPEHPAPQPPNNGCGNQRDGWNQGGGKCSAVPEGGSTFLYLALVGLCCVATAIFSMRRQQRARVTK